MRQYILALGIVSALALTGCETTNQDKTVELEPAAEEATAVETSEESTAREVTSPATLAQDITQSRSANMTDAEKRAAGLPSDEDIELLSEVYDRHEFYSESIVVIDGTNGFDAEAEMVSAAELETFSTEVCQAIDENDGSVRLSTLLKISKNTAVEAFSDPAEHTGAATAVAVYFDCPEYTDSLHDLLLKLTPAPE